MHFQNFRPTYAEVQWTGQHYVKSQIPFSSSTFKAKLYSLKMDIGTTHVIAPSTIISIWIIQNTN